MKPSTEAILARIESGEALTSILRSQLDLVDRETLKRCAAVRHFDRPLFDAVLRDKSGSLDISDLVNQGYVKPIGSGSRFRVTADHRDDLIKAWWDDSATPPTGDAVPDALRTLSEALVRYHEPDDPVEALYHLILVDQAVAEEQFVRLYGEADERFDLAGCRDLLDAVIAPERLSVLTSEFAELAVGHQQYLDTRGYWRPDYYASSMFLDRPAPRARLRRLLGRKGDRLLQLHARGGMGKTMQLRWFIARHCVPEPRRIPSARVDFDVVDPVNASREPWLLLLELAQQLNGQIAGGPFDELLREHGRFLSRLSRAGGDAPRRKSASGPTERQAGDAGLRFRQALNESMGRDPIFVVFDTLEEMLLRPASAVRTFLEEVQAVLDDCPSLRVVLAGRYDLRDRLDDPIVADLDTLELEPFTDAESRRYLTQVCGITRKDAVKLIVERTDGLPFTTGLFAEILRQDPNLPVEDLAGYHDPHLLYLVERVIDRISDQRVRWLLRYGVIPRRLTYGFVEEVMAPHLRESMAGGSTHDDVADDRIPPRETPVFRTDLLPSQDAPLDLEHLWTRLADYASGSSWIALHPGESQTLVFHADVVDPMRLVLRDKPIYQLIHGDAVTYFERLADADENAWVQWTREAIFHRFQRDGPAAAEAWRAALDAAQDRGGWAWRAQIAEEVVRSDYVDWEGNPRPWSGVTPIIEVSHLAHAHLERANCAIEQARVAPTSFDSPLWSEVERALVRVHDLLGPRAGDVLGVARLARARVALAVARGQRDEAIRILDEALGADLDEHDRLWLQVAAASLTDAPDQQHARYRAAAQTAAAVGDRAVLRQALEALTELDSERDRLAQALDWSTRALQIIPGDDLDARAAALDHAQLMWRSGRFTSAWDLASEAVASGMEPIAHWCVTAAHAALALRRPEAALNVCERGLAALGPEDMAEGGLLLEVSGIALRELMDTPAALSRLEAASRAWRSAGLDRPAARAVLRGASLHLRKTGNLREAGVLLEQAQGLRDLPVTRSSNDDRAAFDLVMAEHAHRLGETDQAEQLVADCVTQLQAAGAPPRRVAEAALVGLIQAASDRRELFTRELVRQLSRMTPVSSRLVIMGDLVRATTIEGVSPSTWSDLEALVTSTEEAGLGPADRAALSLVTADLDRLAGRDAVASTRLMEACRSLAGGLGGFAWWEWARRVGLRRATSAEVEMAASLLAALLRALDVDAKPSDPRTDADVVARRPNLAATALIQLGELLTTGREFDLAGKALDAIDRDRASALIASAWDARADLLRARVLQAKGGRRAGRNHLLRALAQYDALGDQINYDSLREADQAIEAEPPPDEPSRVASSSAIHLRLAPSPDGQLVEATWHLADGPVTIDDVRSPIAAIGTRDNLALSGYAATLVERWAPTGRTLCQPFRPIVARALPGSTISLEIADLDLATLPWELALDRDGSPIAVAPQVGGIQRTGVAELAERHEIRMLQETLALLDGQHLPVDGRLGPRTQARLAAFQRAAGMTDDGRLAAETWDALHRAVTRAAGRPRVLVARPGLSAERRRLRGSQLSGHDMARLYSGFGFDVEVVENPTLGQLTERLAHSDHAVVHLSGRLDLTFGASVLDMSDSSIEGSSISEMTNDEGPISASRLSHILQKRRPGRPPVVVLDPARPATLTEGARHLLLRNRFASQLLALGGAPIIVATGFFGVHDTPAVETLIRALAAGETVASSCATVRRTSTAGDHKVFESVLGGLALALFVDVPHRSLTRVAPR